MQFNNSTEIEVPRILVEKHLADGQLQTFGCILLARNKGSSINPSHLHVARAIYVWSRYDQCH
jgi:hypothetical protein